MLDFIEEDWRAHLIEEAAWIGPGACLDIGILQKYIARFGENAAKQRGFPGAPGTS
jgi:hypothetical protein